MKRMAGSLLLLVLVGCVTGPRWTVREEARYRPGHYDEYLSDEPATHTPGSLPTEPLKGASPQDGPKLSVPPLPSQREEGSYEQSARPRGLWGAMLSRQDSRQSTSSRAMNRSRRGVAPPSSVARSSTQEESFRRLTADLEKIKREKAALETKLAEENAKQTQQRLELEARLALLQEQLKLQQSQLQQVHYQSPPPAMVRPTSGYSVPTMHSTPAAPTYSMPFSAPAPAVAPAVAPIQQPTTGTNSGYMIPQWSSSPNLSSQSVEQWPYSPQR
jgi:hypothetical protein